MSDREKDTVWGEVTAKNKQNKTKKQQKKKLMIKIQN